MRSREAVGLVARREFGERVRERSFLISTLVTLLILGAVLVLPAALGLGDDEPRRVGLAGAASAGLAPALEAARLDDEPVRVVVLPDRTAAARALDDGDVDAVVLDGERILVREELPDDLGLLLQGVSAGERARAALAEAGLDDEQARQVLQPAPLPVDGLAAEVDDDDEQRSALAFVGVLLLYGQLLGYGYWVAAGVVEEKASRIVEILLATIRPRQLLAGKVLGIGALALLQLVGIGVVTVAAGIAIGAIDVPADAIAVAVIVLAWFVLGYAFFACAYAAAGALVPRQEELQNTTTPLSLVLIASFLLSFSAIESPDGDLARVLSIVPPISAMVMPPRMAAGDVPILDVILSVSLMLLAIAVLIPVAARLYEGSILRLGQRVGVRDAWRARRGGAAEAAAGD